MNKDTRDNSIKTNIAKSEILKEQNRIRELEIHNAYYAKYMKKIISAYNKGKWGYEYAIALDDCKKTCENWKNIFPNEIEDSGIINTCDIIDLNPVYYDACLVKFK